MTGDKLNGPTRHDPDRPPAEDGDRVITIVIPQALRGQGAHEPWRPGTPLRLLSQLASDHFLRQPTLTREQLAELVELFKDEPLPDCLRSAVVADLRGTRCRKLGRKQVRRTALEQVELIMLPAAYDEAMNDARAVRQRLKSEARTQPRRAPVTKVPTHRSIALDLVRRRLPSLAGMTDARLTNLVSEVRALLSAGEYPGQDRGGAPGTD